MGQLINFASDYQYRGGQRSDRIPCEKVQSFLKNKKVMLPNRMRGGRSPKTLPTIADSGTLSPTDSRSPPTQPAPFKLWSYYHRGCVAKDPAVMTTNKKKPKQGRDNRSFSSNIPTPALLSFKGNGEETSAAEYLHQHRTFLDNYVLEYIPLSDIERWLFKKLSRSYVTKEPLEKDTDSQEDVLITDKKKDFLNLVNRLREERNEHSVVWELARCVCTAVGADAWRVFKLYPDHHTFVQYFIDDNNAPLHLVRANSRQTSMVCEVAKNGNTLRISRPERPDDFPETPHQLFEEIKREADHVMYHPILDEGGRSSFVIELWRVQQSFSPADEETSSPFLVWGSLALHYCNLYLDKNRERNMSDFLLDVVKAIFEEMVSLDQLIKRILEFAQRLVNADRASLFLVDYRNFELVSTVFDMTFEPGQSRDVEKKEIRMPINRGIAGHVALSGETMNIPDAYSDYRFNREVDEKTGYKTVSILCMPIKVQGKVIGVVQMVNKRNADNFLHEDEVAFEIFSTFFGLALHHARLYDRIMRKEQKYRVALEVLSYHNTCRENEVQSFIRDNEQMTVDLNNFYLDPYKFNEFEKCKAAITMFNDLFDLSKFDVVTLTRFVLTVKKNYRTVPYHNFDHGWSVAHSIYVILKNDVKKRFSYKARLALFVACLCHDLDHRGYTNKYMSEIASPLAAMYSTSTLEHHHFNITVTILQQEGHNIFSHITSEEYKEILGYIRQCILATDLAAFFPNLSKIKQLHEGENKFNWSSINHRDLAMAISMTAADLSASAKPWEIQIKTVKIIFEEFYDQGDKEREAGRTPIPMMDRNKPDEQPDSQVGFLSQICIPCYEMLYKILPNSKPMFLMASKNLHKWQQKADRIRKLKEAGDEISVSEQIDDVFEDNSSGDDIDIRNPEIEKDSDDDDVVTEEVKVTTITTKKNSPEVSWEEEEVLIESEEKIGGRLSKDIEGVTWIDEESVEVKSSETLSYS